MPSVNKVVQFVFLFLTKINAWNSFVVLLQPVLTQGAILTCRWSVLNSEIVTWSPLFGDSVHCSAFREYWIYDRKVLQSNSQQNSEFVKYLWNDNLKVSVVQTKRKLLDYRQLWKFLAVSWRIPVEAVLLVYEALLRQNPLKRSPLFPKQRHGSTQPPCQYRGLLIVAF